MFPMYITQFTDSQLLKIVFKCCLWKLVLRFMRETGQAQMWFYLFG